MNCVFVTTCACYRADSIVCESEPTAVHRIDTILAILDRRPESANSPPHSASCHRLPPGRTRQTTLRTAPLQPRFRLTIPASEFHQCLAFRCRATQNARLVRQSQAMDRFASLSRRNKAIRLLLFAVGSLDLCCVSKRANTHHQCKRAKRAQRQL